MAKTEPKQAEVVDIATQEKQLAKAKQDLYRKNVEIFRERLQKNSEELGVQLIGHPALTNDGRMTVRFEFAPYVKQ